MSRERVGGQSIRGTTTALLRRAPGPGLGCGGSAGTARSRLERGAMEAAVDSTRFGYILELLKRDKVGTAPPGYRGAGRQRPRGETAPSARGLSGFSGECGGRNDSSIQLMYSGVILAARFRGYEVKMLKNNFHLFWH